MKSQKTVQDAVKKLEGPPSQQVIEEATLCHLRPVRLPLNKYDLFRVYNKMFCLHQQRQNRLAEKNTFLSCFFLNCDLFFTTLQLLSSLENNAKLHISMCNLIFKTDLF